MRGKMRFAATVLSLAMAVSCFNSPVTFAENISENVKAESDITEVTESTAKILIGKVEAAFTGDTVEIPVKAYKLNGAAVSSLKVDFNIDKNTFEDVSVLASEGSTVEGTYGEENKYTVNFAGGTNSFEDKDVMFTIKAKVKSTAAYVENGYAFSPEIKEALGAENNSLDLAVEGEALVNVYEFGDVNFDGAVNINDASMVLDYVLNSSDRFNDDQVRAAAVYGTEISAKDASAILQSVLGEDFEIIAPVKNVVAVDPEVSDDNTETTTVGSDDNTETTTVGSDDNTETTTVGSDDNTETTTVGSDDNTETTTVGSDDNTETTTTSIDVPVESTTTAPVEGFKVTAEGSLTLGAEDTGKVEVSVTVPDGTKAEDVKAVVEKDETAVENGFVISEVTVDGTTAKFNITLDENAETAAAAGKYTVKVTLGEETAIADFTVNDGENPPAAEVNVTAEGKLTLGSTEETNKVSVSATVPENTKADDVKVAIEKEGTDAAGSFTVSEVTVEETVAKFDITLKADAETAAVAGEYTVKVTVGETAGSAKFTVEETVNPPEVEINVTAEGKLTLGSTEETNKVSVSATVPENTKTEDVKVTIEKEDTDAAESFTVSEVTVEKTVAKFDITLKADTETAAAAGEYTVKVTVGETVGNANFTVESAPEPVVIDVAVTGSLDLANTEDTGKVEVSVTVPEGTEASAVEKAIIKDGAEVESGFIVSEVTVEGTTAKFEITLDQSAATAAAAGEYTVEVTLGETKGSQSFTVNNNTTEA